MLLPAAQPAIWVLHCSEWLQQLMRLQAPVLMRLQAPVLLVPFRAVQHPDGWLGSWQVLEQRVVLLIHALADKRTGIAPLSTSCTLPQLISASPGCSAGRACEDWARALLL